MTYKQEDMPMTEDGIVPDIIVNPNGIPKRMSIGQLIECAFSKVGALKGMQLDGTPYRKTEVSDIIPVLEELGFKGSGSEILYNGKTGEQLTSDIFIGPTFYYRLKHLVQDKIHCLDYETEILTKNGWKKHFQLNMNDYIATLKNNKLVYEKPLHIYDYPEHIGNIYTIENDLIDFKVTDGHRMWVSEFKTTDNTWSDFNFEYSKNIIGKHRKYKKDALWENNNFTLSTCYNMDDLLILFGLLYNENCIVNLNDNGFITLIINEQNVKNMLFKTFENMNIKYLFKENKICIDNSEKELYKLMCELNMNTFDKKMPQWVFELSKLQTQKLICFIQLSNKTTIYKTLSNELADQLQHLTLHAGWTSIITKKIEQNNIVLYCNIIKNNFNPSINENGAQQPQVEYLEENVKCPVWCVNVSSEVFYIRRNGKTCWTGNSRSSGPYQLLTKQPAEGRSRDGGLRVGEMERDALISHGVVGFLKERMFDCSDKYYIWVDKETGMISPVNPSKNKYVSLYSNNTTRFAKVQIPHASKLLFQELMSLGIVPRIHTSNKV